MSGFTPLAETLEYSWTVTGASKPDPSNTWSVFPATDKPVTELKDILFLFTEDNFLDMAAVKDGQNFALYKDGKVVSTVKSTSTNLDLNPHTFTIPLKNPQTEPGTYTLVIPAGDLKFYDNLNDYSKYTTNAQELRYTWTIEGDVPFSFASTPADGYSERGEIKEVKFEYFNCASAALDASLASGITLTRDEKPVSLTWTVANTADPLGSVLTPSAPLTEAGTYKLTLPEKMLYYQKTDAAVVAYEPVVINFTIVAPAQPVAYDLLPTSTSPVDNATIDLANKSFNTLFVNVPEGVNVKAGNATITITNEDAEYSQEATLKFSFNTRLWASFNEPSKNGYYVITIPQGSFGDADWQNDPTTGHANPEIKINVNLIGGSGAAFDLAYTAYTPTEPTLENIGKFTITYPTATLMTENATVTLQNADLSYNESAKFTMNTDVNCTLFEAEFTPAPTAAGSYRLTIPMGTFFDAKFKESEGKEGHANPEIRLDWNQVTGIVSVSVEGQPTRYYNLQGQPVANPAKGEILIEVKEGKTSKIRF